MTPEETSAFLAEGIRTAKVATTARDGGPHVVPVWFVLDGDGIVFTTSESSVKGRHLLRDDRIALCVDDEAPPFAYVSIRGRAILTREAPDLLAWTTRIAARYMGEEQADEYGRRNAVPEELLVRVTPERTIAKTDVAGW